MTGFSENIQTVFNYFVRAMRQLGSLREKQSFFAVQISRQTKILWHLKWKMLLGILKGRKYMYVVQLWRCMLEWAFEEIRGFNATLFAHIEHRKCTNNLFFTYSSCFLVVHCQLLQAGYRHSYRWKLCIFHIQALCWNFIGKCCRF